MLHGARDASSGALAPTLDAAWELLHKHVKKRSVFMIVCGQRERRLHVNAAKWMDGIISFLGWI